MRLLPRHWWENRFGPGEPTPLKTFKRVLKEMFSKIRIDLCWGENDGFDVGAFYVYNKRAWWRFMLHRQGACDNLDHKEDLCLRPECAGPWRLMIAIDRKAFDGFEASTRQRSNDPRR